MYPTKKQLINPSGSCTQDGRAYTKLLVSRLAKNDKRLVNENIRRCLVESTVPITDEDVEAHITPLDWIARIQMRYFYNNAITFGEPSVNGVAIRARFIDQQMAIVQKIANAYYDSDYGNATIRYETLVARSIFNPLHEQTQCFTHTYGAFGAAYPYVPGNQPGSNIKELYMRPNSRRGWTTTMIQEYVTNSTTMNKFITICTPIELALILDQTFMVLKYSFDRYQMVHNDLHVDNVLVQFGAFKLPFDDRGISYPFRIRIIDYGYAMGRVGSRVFVPPEDVWVFNRDNLDPKYDLLRLLTRIQYALVEEKRRDNPHILRTPQEFMDKITMVTRCIQYFDHPDGPTHQREYGEISIDNLDSNYSDFPPTPEDYHQQIMSIIAPYYQLDQIPRKLGAVSKLLVRPERFANEDSVQDDVDRMIYRMIATQRGYIIPDTPALDPEFYETQRRIFNNLLAVEIDIDVDYIYHSIDNVFDHICELIRIHDGLVSYIQLTDQSDFERRKLGDLVTNRTQELIGQILTSMEELGHYDENQYFTYDDPMLVSIGDALDNIWRP